MKKPGERKTASGRKQSSKQVYESEMQTGRKKQTGKIVSGYTLKTNRIER